MEIRNFSLLLGSLHTSVVRTGYTGTTDLKCLLQSSLETFLLLDGEVFHHSRGSDMYTRPICLPNHISCKIP